MSETVCQAARRFAKCLLDEYWDGVTLPVPLLGMLPRFGILTKRVNDLPLVFVDSGKSVHRQRFALALLLGYVVDSVESGRDEYCFSVSDFGVLDGRGFDDFDLLEFFANEFALSLLMPVEAIDRLQQQGLSAREIARVFGVSFWLCAQVFQV